MRKLLGPVGLLALLSLVACAPEGDEQKPAPEASRSLAGIPQARGRVGSTDERANVPNFIWADPVRGPRPARTGTPEQVAREHIASFASALTGKSPKGAILTLEDPYLRNLLIETFEHPEQFQRETVVAKRVGEQSSARKGIGAGVVLAALVLLVIVGAASYWLVYLR